MHKTKPLPDQVVVVTGASSGIGRATAMEFGRHGARVVAAARGREALIAVVEEIEAASRPNQNRLTPARVRRGFSTSVRRPAPQPVHPNRRVPVPGGHPRTYTPVKVKHAAHGTTAPTGPPPEQPWRSRADPADGACPVPAPRHCPQLAGHRSPNIDGQGIGLRERDYGETGGGPKASPQNDRRQELTGGRR